MKTAKELRGRKFKTVEKDAPKAPIKDVQWEGEELAAISETHIEDDKGTGQTIDLRFFDFAVNPEAFKQQIPTAQELFNTHWKGMLSLMWKDGWKPYEAIEPRFMFSKDRKYYRFIIACIPTMGNVIADKPRTLTELIK